MIEFLISLLNIGAIPEIYSYTAFAVFVVFFYQRVKVGKINLNALACPIIWIQVLMGFFFSLHYPHISTNSFFVCVVLYCFVPLLVFVSGFQLLRISSANSQEVFLNILYSIIVGCAIHCLLNIIVNLGNDRWHLVDFFVGNRSATNSGALNTFVFSFFPAILLEKRIKYKVVGMICLFISLVYAFILGTRTQIYMLIIVCFISLMLNLLTQTKKTIDSKLLGAIFAVFLMCISGVTLALVYNLGGIKDKILNSNLLYRYADVETAGSDSYRRNLVIKGLIGLWNYPFGENREVTYFHNYWLDVGRVGGIIPFALAVLITVIMLIHVARLFSNVRIRPVVRYAVIGVFLGVSLNYLMEPIMDGFFHLINRFILYTGMIEALYAQYGFETNGVAYENSMDLQH